MHIKTVNEKPYHPPESTGSIFPVHPPLMTPDGTARLRYMYKQKSYVYFKQDWLAVGVCQLVCQATAVAQFHVHVILQLPKINLQ